MKVNFYFTFGKDKFNFSFYLRFYKSNKSNKSTKVIKKIKSYNDIAWSLL